MFHTALRYRAVIGIAMAPDQSMSSKVISTCLVITAYACNAPPNMMPREGLVPCTISKHALAMMYCDNASV